MYKSIVAFAVVGLVSGCTTAAPQPAQTASTAQERQCEVVEDDYTESLIKKRQECETVTKEAKDDSSQR